MDPSDHRGPFLDTSSRSPRAWPRWPRQVVRFLWRAFGVRLLLAGGALMLVLVGVVFESDGGGSGDGPSVIEIPTWAPRPTPTTPATTGSPAVSTTIATGTADVTVVEVTTDRLKFVTAAGTRGSWAFAHEITRRAALERVGKRARLYWRRDQRRQTFVTLVAPLGAANASAR